MIKTKHWHDLPSKRVRSALPRFTWTPTSHGSPGVATAALMLYVVLRFMADNVSDEEGGDVWVTRATYDDLCTAAGLSRTMVQAGLRRLEAEQLVTSEGSHQKRAYRLVWNTDETGWFKLPCLAIATGTLVRPFAHFKLRSKHELHAMKLYLYLAAVRRNHETYTSATYETIHAKLGIAEREVRTAISLLLTTGLLASVGRQGGGTLAEPVYGANMYFLTGHHNLVRESSVRSGDTAGGSSREDVLKGFGSVEV